MNTVLIATTILVLAIFGFWMGRKRSVAVVEGQTRSLHSRPQYYGIYVAMWGALPALAVVAIWTVLQPQIAEMVLIANLPDSADNLNKGELSLLINDIKNSVSGNIVSKDLSPQMQAAAAAYERAQVLGTAGVAALGLLIAVAGIAYGWRLVNPRLRARRHVETVVKVLMIVASTIAIMTTIGIVLSLLFEAIRFFSKIPVSDFLLGLKWSPQTAIRAEQVGASGAFGAIPLFTGTLLITFIAMCVAVPIGLFSAIYMSEYAGPKLRATAKPLLEILAGVPTVVYGFFAALTVAPFFRDFGESLGLDVASESALAAGGVMGIMIIPFVSSLSDDVMNSVPQSLRDGAYALGATQSETVKQVILPAALPGIVGAVLLAISRAIGETMIVVMAAGLAANLTANPLEAVTTVTVQIVTLLTGDQEFDSAKTLSAFALGLTLFVFTLALNIVALRVVRKYREKYD
jgi:phosphate transport system permease protein